MSTTTITIHRGMPHSALNAEEMPVNSEVSMIPMPMRLRVNPI